MPGCAAYGTSQRTDRGCSPRSCVTGISNRLGGPGLPTHAALRGRRCSYGSPGVGSPGAPAALVLSSSRTRPHRPPSALPAVPFEQPRTLAKRRRAPRRLLLPPARVVRARLSAASSDPPVAPHPGPRRPACRGNAPVCGVLPATAVSAHVGPSPRCLRPQPTAAPLLGLCGDSAGAVSPASGTVCPCGQQGQRPPISTRTGVRKAPDDAGRGNRRRARQPLGAAGRSPVLEASRPSWHRPGRKEHLPTGQGHGGPVMPGDRGGRTDPPPQPQGQLGPATPWLWARGLRSRDRTSVCCLKTSSCGRLLRGPRDLGARRPATCGRPGGPPRGAWRPAGTPVPASESHSATIFNV